MNRSASPDKPSLLPKAELHCHLEGTITPALATSLAQRHGLDIGGLIDDDGVYIWQDFLGFLDCYDAMSTAVRTQRDYYDITHAYYEHSAREGVIYAEVFISPEHGQRYGLPYRDMVDAIAQAMDDAQAHFGIAGRMLVTCVRHLGPEQAERTATLAADSPHPMVTGFGMAGDENAHQPAQFKRAFAIANDAGLALTAHAGEHDGPSSIRAVIDELGVSRIGHGVRACEDAALVDRLREEGQVLELCPSSNICLGVTGDYAAHPVVRYLQDGLQATLNSDDPPFFFTTIGREYAKIAQAHALSDQQMLQFTRNAVNGAFCDDALKQHLRQRLDDWSPVTATPGEGK